MEAVDVYTTQQLSSTPIETKQYGKGPVALEKAAADFESIFLQMVLKEMMPTEGTFFGEGTGSKMYQGMFIDAVAREMSAQGILGIKSVIEREYLDRVQRPAQEEPVQENPVQESEKHVKDS